MEGIGELIKVECPECEGRGFIAVPCYDEYAVSYNFYDDKDCPTCHGVGFIYKEKEE